ncbi:MAG: peptidase M16 [Dehalococcoidales bacterium]|nr:peptidase M16 [Dehalococcoidales bacterium]
MHQKTTLDNGLRIVTTTLPHTRSVSVGIFIGVGSRYETEEQAGISHFIEHLLFRGTSKRVTAKEISEAIEGVGGSLNGGTDKELTLYWGRVAQPNFLLALDVLADMLLNSKLDAEDIERERQIIIEEMHMTKDSPSQQVHMLVDEILWPGHPLGRDIAGTKQSMATISRDMMTGYLENKYLPGNTVISISGNIQHQEAVDAVSQVTGGWTNSKSCPDYPAYEEQTNPRLLLEKRDTEQVHLCLALPGLSLLDSRRYTLGLLNVILGEGMSSRLFTEIRDKLGLAYSIHSYIDHFLDSGAVTVYAGVEPKNLPVAVKAITEQLSKLKEPISEPELSKAKELSKGRLLLRMEDTRSVTGWMGGQEALTGEILSVDQVVANIEAITTDQLNELARELLVSDGLRLAAVGPVTGEDALDALLKL